MKFLYNNSVLSTTYFISAKFLEIQKNIENNLINNHVSITPLQKNKININSANEPN
jgi:glycopeptide antibiotics resistance protein